MREEDRYNHEFYDVVYSFYDVVYAKTDDLPLYEEYAQKNFERMKKLYEGGYIAKDVLEQAEAGAKRAGASLLSAEAAIKVARFELDKAQTALRHSAAENTRIQGKIVTIQAPVNGSVLKIYRESREWSSPEKR
jgi:HlyD family secretion protein